MSEMEDLKKERAGIFKITSDNSNIKFKIFDDKGELHYYELTGLSLLNILTQYIDNCPSSILKIIPKLNQMPDCI